MGTRDLRTERFSEEAVSAGSVLEAVSGAWWDSDRDALPSESHRDGVRWVMVLVGAPVSSF